MMSGTGDDIQAAGGIAGAGTLLYSLGRGCMVQIDNATKSISLNNPKIHLISGDCTKPLESEVKPGANGVALYEKAPLSLAGSVGVFTYDLFNTTEKMAVMFSVPFNFNLFENWYAVGVFSSNKKCDYDLFYEMYYNEISGFERKKAKDCDITYEHSKVVIKASMSDLYNTFLKVTVNEIV